MRTMGGYLFNMAESFQKQSKTYEEQIELLKSRGLVFSNEPGNSEKFAIECLTHCNYYRLSLYRYPLCEKTDHTTFFAGTKFSDLWDIYRFDIELRHLIDEICELIEVSVKSVWAHEISQKYGPFACYDPKLHSNRGYLTFDKLLEKIDDEIRKAKKKENFIEHFKNKYGRERPPIWAIPMVISFGTFSRLFDSLKHGYDRNLISTIYGLDERVFRSWLHHITHVRNYVAHHSRIWNRSFTFIPILPEKKPIVLKNSLRYEDRSNPYNKSHRKIYNTLVLLVYLKKIIAPRSDWEKRLIALLKTGETKGYLQHMGFLSDWKEREIWIDRRDDVGGINN